MRLAIAMLLLLAACPLMAAPDPAPILHHNPFEKPADLTRPPGAASALTARPAPPWSPVLRATVVSAGVALANVDGHVLAVGDVLHGYRLVSVEPRRAVFEKAGTRRVLTMN